MLKKNRDAFTMIELVLALVVLGILAALAMPRLERDTRQEAEDSIVAAIRYAQHMALSDNVIDPTNPTWQRKFWRFGVRTCTGNDIFYYVGSDKDMGGNISNSEAAIDPANGGRMLGPTGASCPNGNVSGVSSDIFIAHKYGISNTNMFVQCGGGDGDAARYVGFDYLGRPHAGFAMSVQPNYSSVLKTDCNLTFQFVDTSIPNLVITISKETGHVSVQ